MRFSATKQLSQVWKHARFIFGLKSRKGPALSFFNWPINIFDTTGKLFEKMLLARILNVVNEC